MNIVENKNSKKLIALEYQFSNIFLFQQRTCDFGEDK
jgi:hypothetical protein